MRVDRSEVVTDPGALCADVGWPGREESAVGLILDRLAHCRATLRGGETLGCDEPVAAKLDQSASDIVGLLLRQLRRELLLVRALLAPDAREEIERGSVEGGRAPRCHVAVVAGLPEAEQRVLERDHRDRAV